MKYFLGLCLILLSFVNTQQIFAGLIPGTISKWSYRDSTYCETSTKSYSPTSGTYWCSSYKSCASSSCGAQSYNTCANAACGSYTNTCANAACGCATYNGSGSCTAYNTCANAACWTSYNTCQTSGCWVATYNTCQAVDCGCAAYSSSPTGSFSLTDYSDRTAHPIYWSSSANRKLSVDISRSCTVNAYKTESLIEPNYGTWNCPMWNCSPVSFTTRNGGTNAVCGLFSSTDNLITSFDQLGTMVTSAPIDSDGTCTVEGRYATIDDIGPTISVSNAGVFNTNPDTWCSITKWQQAKWLNAWCEALKKLGSHPTSVGTGAVDLLEGLSIVIWGDPSGIGGVVVEIGKCTATYDFPTDQSILASTTNASGVKSPNTQSFTIPYDSSFTFAGIPYPSLKSALGASGLFGLNDCLADGKNYLRITAKDNARSNSDGISLISNATLYVSGLGSANYPDGTSAPSTIGTATINIDEAAPGVKLSGDAKSYYDSNAASNCFIGLATKDPRWKNFTISGGIQAADPFGPNCAPTVSVITPTILTCNFPIAGIGDGNPNSPIYNSPAGVDSVTGKFTAFTYDGFGPTPTIAACDWGCKSGYTKNTATNTCESAAIHICPAGQSWDGVQCAGLPFCTAGGSVPCIVAPGGSANTCSTSKPSCDGTSCALTTGSPSSNNQTWVKGAVNCGFACTNGYTGANCEVAPVANTCCGAYTTTYCYADNGNIIAGNPVISCWQNWQNNPPAWMVNPTAQGTSTTCVTPIECAPSTTYTWVTGNYGSCSVSTCGGGTQTRNIVCQDNNGSTVADSYCTDPKPAETQSCNTQACACPVLWPKITWDGIGWDWGQSMKCWDYTTNCKTTTTGTECNFIDSQRSGTLTLECRSGTWVNMYNACDGISENLTYTWITGNYGTCSATCGGGIQSRTVVCQDNNGLMVADSYCTDPKPAISQDCWTQACEPPSNVRIRYDLFDGTATKNIDGSCELSGWNDSWGCMDFSSVRFKPGDTYPTVTNYGKAGHESVTCKEYISSMAALIVYNDGTCETQNTER